MVKSLVTVASKEEAKKISDPAPDIVDIKNPVEGSLGCAEPATVRNIMKSLPESVEKSVALGDLPHLPGSVSMCVKGAVQEEPDYIKIGLIQTSDQREAHELFEAASKPVEDSPSKLVVAGYADHQKVGTLKPSELVEPASRAGIHGVMVDTLNKQTTSLTEEMPPNELEHFIDKCRDKNLFSAVAGSVRLDECKDLAKHGPGAIGVRGAVASKSRDSKIDIDKVSKFVETLKQE